MSSNPLEIAQHLDIPFTLTRFDLTSLNSTQLDSASLECDAFHMTSEVSGWALQWIPLFAPKWTVKVNAICAYVPPVSRADVEDDLQVSADGNVLFCCMC